MGGKGKEVMTYEVKLVMDYLLNPLGDSKRTLGVNMCWSVSVIPTGENYHDMELDSIIL